MILKRIYRVKITRCSLPILWYRDHIGKEYNCELLSSTDRLFSYFISSAVAFKAVQPVFIEVKNKGYVSRVHLPNGGEKFIYISKESTEQIEVGGWILEDDCEILDMIEEIIN